MTIVLGHVDKRLDDYSVYLQCQAQIDDETFTLKIKIDDTSMADFVVDDRCDAFLFAILPYALRKHHDIICRDVVSDTLLFNLRTQYIPSLSKYDDNLHPVHITAKSINVPIKSKNEVATGLSCGVDCMHTIIENRQHDYFQKISYFLVFNEGAFGGDYYSINRQFAVNKIFKMQQDLANELSIPIIKLSNNLEELMKIPYDQFVVYSMGMLVLSISKLIGTYLYSSSGGDYSTFSIQNSSKKDISYLDLLTLHCISHGPTYFYSAGGSKTRFEKMKYIIDDPLTQNYLFSCLRYDFNCGICPKCYRNLLTIDSLGKLNNFSKVYDIETFSKNKEKALTYLVKEEKFHGYSYSYLHEVYEQYKKVDPELIESIESSLSFNKIMSERDYYFVQSMERKMCLRAYKTLMDDGYESLKNKMNDMGIKRVILYYYSYATDIFINISEQIGINIEYIVEDVKGYRQIPRLPLSTVDYPVCDAIIVCTLSNPEIHVRKLKERTQIPIYFAGEFLDLRPVL